MKKTLTALFLGVCAAGMAVSGQAAEENSLVVGNMGNSIKASMVVLASEMGYYEEEGINVSFENIADLNDGLTAIDLGKIDILPMGIIPTVTFISQGSDFVIYGGTIAEGSQAIITEEKKDTISDMDTVNFVEMDGFQSVIEAVKKGTADVGEFAPDAVCCRQTTSKSVIEKKRDALVKFQIANLRAMELAQNDRETTIKTLMDYSGQSEEYVDYCIYADVMKISMDPAKKRIQDFYEVMESNGDIPKDSKWNADEAVDTTIYEEALNTMIEREPAATLWRDLKAAFEENN